MGDVAAAKGLIRHRIGDRLQRDGIARFPSPPKGRIPSFAGAEAAAERLLEHPLLRRARCINVNSDPRQRPVRRLTR